MKTAHIVAALSALALAGCATTQAAPPPPPAAAPAPVAAPGPSPEEQLKQQEAVLEHKPSVPPLQGFSAPVPETATFANGLTLIVVQRKDAALTTVEFVTKHGALDDGKQPGLAVLAGEMLQAGSAGRSASQIAQEVTALGTELHLGASREDLTGTLTVLPEKLAQATALLGEIVLRPNLSPKELERVRAQTLSKLVAQLDEPTIVANNAVERVLYGNGPFGTPLFGTASSVKGIQMAAVKRYLAGIGGANSAVVVVGPVAMAEVRPLVEKAFGALPKGKPEPALAPKLEAKRPPVVVLDKPGAPQTVVRLAGPGIGAKDPNRYALRLADTIFGGSFTSRLNQNLREAHGYTYGAGAQFQAGRNGGTFWVNTSVKTDVTGASLHEIQGELDKMLAPGLTPAEVDKAKALFTANLVDMLQTTPSTARMIGGLWASEVPLDELSRMLPAIAKLTAEEVNAAWKAAVNPRALTIVLVGDQKTIDAQVEEQKLPKPVPMTPAK